MKKSVTMLKNNWHWLFFVLIAILTIYMDVYVAHNFLDGDTSDDLYHGWIIAQQKNPFTRDVYLSTELRLLDIASVYSLFFLFLQDWTLVRILGTIAMQTLYVLSFLYMCRQANIGFPAALAAAGLMLTPFSTSYARIVLYHLYYILYFTNAFWIIGLTLKLVQLPEGKTKKRVIPALLLTLLWFFVGLNGVRHMLILGLPMLMFAMIEVIHTLNRSQYSEDGRINWSRLRQEQSFRLAGVLAGSCLCFLLGYVINNVFLLDYYGVGNIGDITCSINITAERIIKILKGGLIAIGGRHSDMKFISLRGISLVAALFGFGYVLIISWRSIKNDDKKTTEKLTYSLFGISTITSVLIFLFECCERWYELYFIPILFLAFPVIALELKRLLDHNTPMGTRILILISCLCFLFQGAYTTFFLRVEKDKWDDWNGLSMTNLALVDESRDCIDFMQENGYTHGMVDYWYANVMMEMTDGKLTIAPLVRDYDQWGVTIYQWGTSKTAFLPEKLPQKVIVFILHKNAKEFEKAVPDAAFVFDGYVFGGYEIDAESITY